MPRLNALGGYEHFFMGMPLREGARSLVEHLGRTLDNFYFDALRFSGFIAACAGLLIAARLRLRGVLWTALGCALLFAVVMLKAGDAFWKHAYYVLPFVPVMAMLAGTAVARIPKAWMRAAAMAIIVAEGLGNQWHDLRPSPVQEPLLGLEPALDALGPRTERIVVNSGAIPTPLYMAHRKGWTAHGHQLEQPAFLDSLAALGCTRIVLLHQGYEETRVQRPVQLQGVGFTIHAMR